MTKEPRQVHQCRIFRLFCVMTSHSVDERLSSYKNRMISSLKSKSNYDATWNVSTGATTLSLTTLSITTFSIPILNIMAVLLCWVSFMLSVIYTRSHLWWVSFVSHTTHTSPLCWVALFRVSLCWVSWRLSTRLLFNEIFTLILRPHLGCLSYKKMA